MFYTLKTYLRLLIVALVVLFIQSSLSISPVHSQDITIGTQTWTSKNLDVSTFRNGEDIPEVKSKDEWRKAGNNRQPAFCYYNFESKNGKVYGKLYNWYAVNDSRGLAPKGYHIPSDAEWTILKDKIGVEFITGKGMISLQGTRMKSTTLWYRGCGKGNNSSGFNGLPGGVCCDVFGNFFGITSHAGFWSSSEAGANSAWIRYLYCGTSVVGRHTSNNMELLSVRCIRENGDIKSGSNSNHVSKVENISDKVNNTVLQNHSTVTIGTQVWTSKNLDVSTFRNGEPIPEAKSVKEWKKAGENKQPAWCYNDNDPNNGEKYGKLYNWFAVNDSRGLAPKGYHIPSDTEWSVLIDFLGGEYKAGHKMKSMTGWNMDDIVGKINGNGTNSSRFNGLPSGYRGGNGVFAELFGCKGLWWSSTEWNTGFAYLFLMICSDHSAKKFDATLEKGLSVRCVKDYKLEYSVVYIGNQVWTSKNLDVCIFRNGDQIPEAKSKEEWKKAGKNEQPAWCYYNNDPKNGEKYGKLYNWFAVNDSRGLAPEGYHIPSDTEWTLLTDFLGGQGYVGGIAGYNMRNTTDWKFKGSGTNGFNALPGDLRNNEGTFQEYGGLWWCSSDFDSRGPWHIWLSNLDGAVYRGNNIDKEAGLSVRCIRD